MILNASSKISDDGGDYIVLADYGTEGISVAHQFTTLQEALQVFGGGAYDCLTLVKLVRFEVAEEAERSE